MDNKGFILMDVIVGLFIMGLIVVVSLPLLSSAYSNYSNLNALTEMNYIGEGIYERLNSMDDYSEDLFDQLIENNQVIYNDLNEDYLSKYESKIFNLDYDENFLDIMIIIKSISHGGNIPDVEFKGSIPRRK